MGAWAAEGAGLSGGVLQHRREPAISHISPQQPSPPAPTPVSNRKGRSWSAKTLLSALSRDLHTLLLAFVDVAVPLSEVPWWQ